MKRSDIRRIGKKKAAQLEAEGRRAFSTFTNPPRALLESRSALRKVNPEQSKKAAQRYAKGLARYRASETYQIVEARAGGRCEFFVGAIAGLLYVSVKERPGFARCEHPGKDHHHCSYKGFGGNETPAQMRVGCARCHAHVEAAKPAGNRRSRSMQLSRGQS